MKVAPLMKGSSVVGSRKMSFPVPRSVKPPSVFNDSRSPVMADTGRRRKKLEKNYMNDGGEGGVV